MSINEVGLTVQGIMDKCNDAPALRKILKDLPLRLKGKKTCTYILPEVWQGRIWVCDASLRGRVFGFVVDEKIKPRYVNDAILCQPYLCKGKWDDQCPSIIKCGAVWHGLLCIGCSAGCISVWDLRNQGKDVRQYETDSNSVPIDPNIPLCRTPGENCIDGAQDFDPRFRWGLNQSDGSSDNSKYWQYQPMVGPFQLVCRLEGSFEWGGIECMHTSSCGYLIVGCGNGSISIWHRLRPSKPLQSVMQLQQGAVSAIIKVGLQFYTSHRGSGSKTGGIRVFKSIVSTIMGDAGKPIASTLKKDIVSMKQFDDKIWASTSNGEIFSINQQGDALNVIKKGVVLLGSRCNLYFLPDPKTPTNYEKAFMWSITGNSIVKYNQDGKRLAKASATCKGAELHAGVSGKTRSWSGHIVGATITTENVYMVRYSTNQ